MKRKKKEYNRKRTILNQEFSQQKVVLLNQVADEYKNTNYKVVIHGHTDDVGDTASNIILAEKRANNVRNYLIQQGVPANRLEIVASGEGEPVGDNLTAEGRRKNRRVEILLVKLNE